MKYVHKLDSIATCTPKNQPLFEKNVQTYTALGVAADVANGVYQYAPKAQAVVKTVASDIAEEAKNAYDWAAEHSLVWQIFGKEAVDNANKFVFGGGLFGLLF